MNNQQPICPIDFLPGGPLNVNINTSKIRSLSNDTVHEICRRLENGETSISIDTLLELPRDTANRIKRKEAYTDISCMYNIPDTKNKLKESEVRRICELLCENRLSPTEIANQIGCTRDAVNHIRKRDMYHDIVSEYDFEYEKRCAAPLTEDKVRQACLMLSQGGYSLQEIADAVGSSKGVIWKIKNRVSYPEITKEYNY